MDDLKQRMWNYRVKHRLSRAKFAKLCGISLQTAQYVERGLQKPSAMTVAKIELVLKEEE